MAQRPPLPTSGSVDSQESGRRGSGSPAPSFSNFTGALSKVGFASKRFTVRITTNFFYLWPGLFPPIICQNLTNLAG